MALKLLNQNANLSTSDGSWLTAAYANITYEPGQTAVTYMTTSGLYSATFTVTSGISLLGVFSMIRYNNTTASRTYRIALEENINSVWTEVATTATRYANEFGSVVSEYALYIPFNTPVTSTTNQYRIRWVTNTASTFGLYYGATSTDYLSALFSNNNTAKPNGSSDFIIINGCALNFDESYPASGTMTSPWTSTIKASMLFTQGATFKALNEGGKRTIALNTTVIYMWYGASIRLGTEADPITYTNQFKITMAATTAQDVFTYKTAGSNAYLTVFQSDCYIYSTKDADDIALTVAQNYTSDTLSVVVSESIPASWANNNKIVVFGTANANADSSNSEVTISSINRDTKTITLATQFYRMATGAKVANSTLAGRRGVVFDATNSSSNLRMYTFSSTAYFTNVYINNFTTARLSLYYAINTNNSTAPKASLSNIYVYASYASTVFCTLAIRSGTCSDIWLRYTDFNGFSVNFTASPGDTFDRVYVQNGNNINILGPGSQFVKFTDFVIRSQTIILNGAACDIYSLYYSYGYITNSSVGEFNIYNSSFYPAGGNSTYGGCLVYGNAASTSLQFYNCKFAYGFSPSTLTYLFAVSSGSNYEKVTLINPLVYESAYIVGYSEESSNSGSTNIDAYSSVNSFYKAESYNGDVNDNRLYAPTKILRSLTSNTELSVKSTPKKYNSYVDFVITTRTIASIPVRISINAEIQNANYYSGVLGTDYTLPSISAAYAGGSVSASALANTTKQAISILFTPNANLALINLRLNQFSSTANLADREVIWDSLKIVARKFGYKEKNVTTTVYQFIQYPIDSIDIVDVDPFITVTNQSTVAAYTALAIDHVNKTYTASDARTFAQMFDYEKYDISLSENLDKDDWFRTIDGVTFYILYSLILHASQSFNGLTIKGSERITDNGAQFTNCRFAECLNANGYFVWSASTNISNSTFADNDVAIEIAQAGEYTLNNITFSGNTTDIHVSATEGVVKLNISGGNTPQTITTDGATIDLNAGVVVTLQANVSLAGAEIRVYDYDNNPAGSLGTELQGTESNAGSTYAISGTSGNQVFIQVMKDGYVEYGRIYTMPTVSQAYEITLDLDTNN